MELSFLIIATYRGKVFVILDKLGKASFLLSRCRKWTVQQFSALSHWIRRPAAVSAICLGADLDLRGQVKKSVRVEKQHNIVFRAAVVLVVVFFTT